ncbi:terpene synthase 1-like [Aristolochia californica]|uniref:terpene synthase 1-like n=1 Tax=Aristolochia californica TaxID=171875 RepID=UPI0035DACDE7
MSLSWPLSSVNSHSTVVNRKDEMIRRSADFPPSIWGDYFLNHSVDQTVLDKWAKRVNELKGSVKMMLRDAKGSDVHEMGLIDTLQLLGLTYHFDDEIEAAMRRIHDSYAEIVQQDDLHLVALCFRLLRQHGYNVPADIFNKFKTNYGSFDSNLSTNVKGLLSLYEASFFSMRGESILDEAVVFSREQLRATMPKLDSVLSKRVDHALELPLLKRVPRVEARDYISFYQESDDCNELILELAKLDFNLLQALQRTELSELSRWWKDLDLARKLHFAKDRMVEAYLWPLGVNAEPSYSRSRILTTKILAIVSMIDDIYDTYATFEELQPFTDVIQRWDMLGINRLPEYMKVAILGLFNCVKGIEEELALRGRSDRVHYLKEAVKSLSRAYFKESGWHNNGYSPGVEECLSVTSITSTHPLLITLFFLDLEAIATKQVFDWLLSEPKLVTNTGLICRIIDDLESYQFERKRDHVPSVVQFYAIEKGVSEEEACVKLRERVAIAWKDITQASLEPSPLPWSLTTLVANMSRVMEVYYLHGDGYTFPTEKTEKIVTSLLIDPVPI